MLLGLIALGGVVFGVVMWAMTTWADERYVQHTQLVEALEVLGKSLEESDAAQRKQVLEDQIEALQDDIVFFDEEQDKASVKRHCRKLPKVIRNWEEHTQDSWVRDPIVRNACTVVQVQ
jgi:hypothetical protein